MTRPILGALVALLLGACSTVPPPPPNFSDLKEPPAEWLEDAPPLDDVPACKQPTAALRVACRAAYDADTRGKYVALAQRHKAVAGWVRVVASRASRAPAGAR